MTQVGVQTNGMSPAFTKRMALDAIQAAIGDSPLGAIADAGGGWGELTLMLAERAEQCVLLDYAPPAADALPANVSAVQADLNRDWPLESASVDFAFSTEVIEHVENPRHFLREMMRVTKPGGHLFVSTPNNHSLASKLTFLLRGQHRQFQEQCYPAHITPLLRCDFERMAAELGLDLLGWHWSNYDTVPKLHWPIRGCGRLFSVSMGVLLRRPTDGEKLTDTELN
jgi:2-polyprenyl-3-methyl-5-hydroxy-6-metoxy-1,4-benzoquinol methylase